MSAVLFPLQIYLLSITCIGDTIDCLGNQSCKDETKECESNQTCLINCDGSTFQQACQAAIIDASSATDVTLHCVHNQDCVDTELRCGTGRCDIICHGKNQNDDKQQCKFKSVHCGNALCTIYCEGEDSCHDSTFILLPSTSFNCIGYCPSTFPAPSVTMRPTVTPTIYPTSAHSTARSIHPSLVPSIHPSVIDSTNPSVEPSLNPSIQIQSIPSFNASFSPLQNTTNPSRSPTVNHIMQPTGLSILDGTQKPTLHPFAATDVTDKNTNDDNHRIQSIVININPLAFVFLVILIVLICLSILGAIYLKKRKHNSKQPLPKQEVQQKRRYSNHAVVSECVLLKKDTDEMEGRTTIPVEGGSISGQALIVEGMKPGWNGMSHRECIGVELSENEFIVRGDSEDTMNGAKDTEGQY